MSEQIDDTMISPCGGALPSTRNAIAAPADPLELHILRILVANPSLQFSFRREELSTLDTATKQKLLEDIQAVLGIRNLNLTTTK